MRFPNHWNRHTLTAFTLLFVVTFFAWPALAQAAPPGGDRLRDLAARRGLLIGFAPGIYAVGDSAQGPIIAAEANIFTSENNLKWFCLQPQPGLSGYNWNNNIANSGCSSADDDVHFAQTHGMQMHGHTLIWHAGLPDWLETTPFAQLEGLMNTHIDTVVGRYNGSNPAIGQVQVWDVVNEAIECVQNCADQDYSNDQYGYRQSLWYNAMGPQANGVPAYIPKAFQRARQADPNAILLYNDFGLGESSAKSDFLYQEVQKWQSAGVPINGIGFQMHIDINFGQGANSWQFQAFSNDLQRFANLGLDIYLTELDVIAYDPSLFNVQADIYREITHRCLAQPRCKAIQTWGWTDRFSWLNGIVGNNADPLLFDDNFTPKPAYYAVQEALRSVHLEAENHNGQQGVITYPDAMIGNVDGGDWIKFDNVDLGQGYASLRAKYTKGHTADTWVEVRLGSPTGRKVAELHTRSTGGWDYPAYLAERSTLLSGVTGVQTLYFVFAGGGGVGNFDWFRFENGWSQPLEVENRNAGSGVQPTDPTGSTIIYYVQDGAWLRFNHVDLRSGYATVRMRYAKGDASGGTIEVRQGSLTGALLGTIPLASTGDWDRYAESTAIITGGKGIQTLFFVFRGGIANVDSFRLESEDAVLYVAPATAGTIGSLSYDNQDVLAYYLSSRQWRKYFDGSDVVSGGGKIDALEVQRDGRLLLSFAQPLTLGSLLYDDSDILRFTPTAVGETTAGTFSMYFDASDVQLTTSDEDTDALAFNFQNYPLLSTLGIFDVTTVTGEDKDILRFQTATLGNTTSGTWSTYVDGSDINLATAVEDVDGLWVDPDGNNSFPSDIYVSTVGAFAVTNGVSGDGNDLFICNPATLGDTTNCRNRFFRDLGGAGLGTVAVGDFAISSTPRALPAGASLAQASNSAVAEEANLAPIEETLADDPLTQSMKDDTPQDQIYPDEITLADLPTSEEETGPLRHQLFLPVVNHQ